MHAALVTIALWAGLLGAACQDTPPGPTTDAPGRGAPVAQVTAPAPPCAGCEVVVPATGRGALPLLVVLHGDHEDAGDAADRWARIARARGWAVLALTCPRTDGCDGGRWYRWAATPAWIHAQVDALVAQLPVDPARIFLAGWSGGASAIGMHSRAWPSRFAAVVIHGGGQPPRDRACPTSPLPAYLLVGDRNPAHPAAQRLRAYYEACGIPHVWELLPGADHAGEDAALDDARTTRILDWLLDHPRTTAAEITT